MAEFSNYMSPGRKGYLIGIGGVSMSSLAEVLLGMGIAVCGSDSNRSRNVTSLEAKGIHIEIGHRAENIPADTDFVVRTAAVRDENPEIIQARAMNIPVFERTEAWGAISRDYSNAICISGTHGKTTTTSMCTHILMAADKDPTVMIGGTLPLLNAGHRVGHGNVIVMEACEYYNSFLSFHPTIAVILNIEADHLDFFKDLYDVEKSFRAFASRVPQDGYVVANYDDLNTMQTLMNLDRKMITFGLNKKAAEAVGEKNIEMIRSRELLPLTGYIHGGCSPIGMKKLFPTTVDISARDVPKMLFSGGRIGFQVEVSPSDLEKVIPIRYADIVE